MKSRVVTEAIVLSRRDFGEADRIVTVLTPTHGKLSFIAKGVRRPKSKLAGGIELFSVSELTLLPGRGDLETLLSGRLIKNYDHIVKDINRTMLGYEFLRYLAKTIEDSAGGEYFDLLQAGLAGLNSLDAPIDTIETWFNMQLLKQTGHAPNLQTDLAGANLEPDKTYIFNFDDMTFKLGPEGEPSTDLIKYLRLSYAADSPALLAQVQISDQLRATAAQMTRSMLKYNLHISV